MLCIEIDVIFSIHSFAHSFMHAIFYACHYFFCNFYFIFFIFLVVPFSFRFFFVGIRISLFLLLVVVVYRCCCKETISIIDIGHNSKTYSLKWTKLKRVSFKGALRILLLPLLFNDKCKGFFLCDKS